MDSASKAHPFMLKDWGFSVLEVISIDENIDASHRLMGALFIFAGKFNNLVLTLAPQSRLNSDAGPQLRELAKKVNLKIVVLGNEQLPFEHEFVEVFKTPEEAVKKVKSTVIFKKIAKEFADVTPFKSSALNLLSIMNEPDVTFARLEEEIASEPLLIARVLQTANSAYFMRRNKVEDIGQALAYLGLDGFKQVLVSLIFQNLATKYFADQKDRLRHSDAVSYIAIKLAERKIRDTVTLSKVRVAGLLHDIGALALQYCYPEDYKKAQEFQKNQNVSIIDAERKIFGINHCELGARLCLEWGLPPYLMECAKLHHNQSCETNKNIIEPIIIANSFMNIEVEGLVNNDYKQLLPEYCPDRNAGENEAKIEVQSFLYAQWKNFQQSAQAENPQGN